MARKQKVYLTEDMKRKVAREYHRAPRGDRAAIAERYGVSTGSVCRWIRDGLANGEAKAKAPQAKATARPVITILLDLYDDGSLDREDLVASLLKIFEGEA